ncbi:hypothetical protein Pmar_PMAR018568 [Perkinsus marinus ATCC 50983]|uniref:Histone-lysine N-methyltransferase, H3 lysine-79 specific n=1 Tax=Perkinsus marinus (strain ATCC 50983 / TXsc) TaxID=423536 RepID=C5L066_PERM5|nr:hypothetical protein Pmar_PMAR018568 [Perkinsus marinus ATCC 50983]EER09924.1 hypothetical protein Pmar_PMAR018568 [Perkinsus marinus ATCC 50983]|eukprot:XP_002778129.1 hypothetical protein Pmar_PMAR018568 [Perkinsus marinus ATCC 50983]
MRLRNGGAILSTFRLPTRGCGLLGAGLGHNPVVISTIRDKPIGPLEGIKEVERLLDEAYTKACGKDHRVFGEVQVGSREYDRLWRSQGFSPTYGEITPTGVAYLFGVMLPPRPVEHFVDLGSGMGKLCLQAWLQFGHQLSSITGVELSKVRHKRAVAAAMELVTTERIQGQWVPDSAQLDLVLGDMFKLPLHDKTFLYCANLTFSPEILSRLSRKILRESPSGTRVVSMRPLTGVPITEPQECKLAIRGIPEPPKVKPAMGAFYDEDDGPLVTAPPMPADPEFDDSIDPAWEGMTRSRRSFPRTRLLRRDIRNPRRSLCGLRRRRSVGQPLETDRKMLKLVDHLDLPMTWSNHTPLYVYGVVMAPL